MFKQEEDEFEALVERKAQPAEGLKPIQAQPAEGLQPINHATWNKIGEAVVNNVNVLQQAIQEMTAAQLHIQKELQKVLDLFDGALVKEHSTIQRINALEMQVESLSEKMATRLEEFDEKIYLMQEMAADGAS